MTYGWAILIIAIVLGALFALGIFNSGSLASKSPPGSCQVYRPNGPGTTSYINLEGTCNNGLPQYVAQFNGQSSYINVGQMQQESGTAPVSYSVWFMILSLSAPYPMAFGDTGASTRNGYDLFAGGPGSYGGDPNHIIIERLAGGTPAAMSAINTFTLNTWYYAVVTYNGIALSLYLNGAPQGSTASAGSITVDSSMSLGADSGGGVGEFGNYQFADFQAYNTSLTANEITALYDEGIGGVPLNLNSLVGWWPLNGNANDYSGNLNNGVPTSVVYTSSWTSSYSAP